jgi:hypothetical protein
VTLILRQSGEIKSSRLAPQVLILPNFKDFPGTALTLELWMWSADNCRQGTPFSYAHGAYSQQDNSFLLFNYNDW